MALDAQAIHLAFFDRAATDAAGAAIRAALGAGAASVIHAERLRSYGPGALMPARVLLAFRGGPISGASWERRGVALTWWIYDDPAQGYARINGLIPLIEAAYPFDAIDRGKLTVISASAEISDSALGLLSRAVSFSFATRK